MPTSYFDQFFLIDPANPPIPGTALATLTPQAFELIDTNDNNFIESAGTDSINAIDVIAVWPGDRLLVEMNGVVQVIAGTTFYMADGSAYFTPRDGKILSEAEYLDSRYVVSQSPMPVGDLGPPCLTEGTLVATLRGRIPVEQLEPGDLIVTKDNALQPLIWLGQTTVAGDGDYAPIRIEAGVLGNSETLHVSPQHRMLVAGWKAELVAGVDEVFVAARHLVDYHQVCPDPRPEVTYYHLLFARHEIIEAGGAWSESYLPANGLESYEMIIHAALERSHPGLANQMKDAPLARPQVRGFEASLLAA